MAKTYKPIHHLPQKLRYGKIVTWSMLAALPLLFAYWSLGREEGAFTIWCVQSLPLLAIAPGIYKQLYRSYSWLCFLLLFYFILAVERALISTSSWSDYVFLALVVGLFISSMMTSRWLQRTQKQHLIEPKESDTNV